MRGQFERDQIMLEQYGRCVLLIFVVVQETLEGELQGLDVVAGGQMAVKDELIKQLQERNKYDVLTKPYSQLWIEHLECTSSSPLRPVRPARYRYWRLF